MDPELFQDAGYSLLGYDKVLRFGDICVCYEPRENGFFKDMGVCVSLHLMNDVVHVQMALPVVAGNIYPGDMGVFVRSQQLKQHRKSDPPWMAVSSPGAGTS